MFTLVALRAYEYTYVRVYACPSVRRTRIRHLDNPNDDTQSVLHSKIKRDPRDRTHSGRDDRSDPRIGNKYAAPAFGTSSLGRVRVVRTTRWTAPFLRPRARAKKKRNRHRRRPTCECRAVEFELSRLLRGASVCQLARLRELRLAHPGHVRAQRSRIPEERNERWNSKSEIDRPLWRLTTLDDASLATLDASLQRDNEWSIVSTSWVQVDLHS